MMISSEANKQGSLEAEVDHNKQYITQCSTSTIKCIPLHKNKETSSRTITETSTLIVSSLERKAIDPSTTALILIDIQPEYWSKSPYQPYTKFPNFPSSLTQLLHTCRNIHYFGLIVWVRANYQPNMSPFLAEFRRFHGQNHVYPSISSSNEGGSGLEWESFAQPSNNALFHDNYGKSRGCKHSNMAVEEIVMPKPSISATTNTNLISILQKYNIKTTLVAGLITSVCVHHSAFGLFEAGFRVIVVKDACADRENDRHDMTFKLYGGYCYDVMDVDEVVEGLYLSNANDQRDTNNEFSYQNIVQMIPFNSNMKDHNNSVIHQQTLALRGYYQALVLLIIKCLWANKQRMELRPKFMGDVMKNDRNKNMKTSR